MASFLDISSVSPIIDELVQKLENDFQIKYRMNVSEIVKGGSLGHGTAVPGKFDLDLVLYSRDIHARDVIANGVKDVLNKLDMFLQSQYGSHAYKKKKITPFALQFTLYQKLDVDLLPSPFWSSSHEFINFMEGLSQQNRRKFQCSEAKWEKLFFQRQPNAVKEYTKRAKKWRERCWNEGVSGTGRPKSILLGLLVAEAYRKVGWNDPRAITRKLQEIVKSHHYMKYNTHHLNAIFIKFV
jgi:hypothetical protein